MELYAVKSHHEARVCDVVHSKLVHIGVKITSRLLHPLTDVHASFVGGKMCPVIYVLCAFYSEI